LTAGASFSGGLQGGSGRSGKQAHGYALVDCGPFQRIRRAPAPSEPLGPARKEYERFPGTDLLSLELAGLDGAPNGVDGHPVGGYRWTETIQFRRYCALFQVPPNWSTYRSATCGRRWARRMR